jgi:hypothetical protein
MVRKKIYHVSENARIPMFSSLSTNEPGASNPAPFMIACYVAVRLPCTSLQIFAIRETAGRP